MESRLDDGEAKAQSEAMAQFYATNTRLKFERVYASFRKAILEDDTKTALLKCKAALDLLNESNIYGESQPALYQLIEGQMERLQSKLP